MKTNRAQSFKVKLDMIVERESLMSQAEFSNPLWFPKYILLRRPIGVDEEGGGAAEVDPMAHAQLSEIKQVSERTQNLEADIKQMQTALQGLQSDVRGLET